MAEKNIGALWTKDGPKGKFLSGVVTIGDTAYQIVIFRNSYKEKPNQPDWQIYPARPRVQLNDNGTEKVEEEDNGPF